METFAPSALTPVDDRLNANSALRRVRAGEYLLYEGDFINAKQLLAAMGRRLRGRAPSGSPIQIFRAQRRTRELEHHALSHLVVALDGEYRLALRRAPNVAQAARWAWGEPRGKRTLVSLKTLLGVIGAAEWRRKGLRVAGLQGTLHPHYGVYLPTRTDYVELVQEVPEVSGKRVLDVGTGTGILSFLLLQRGAKYAVGSDSEPRAIACARENAQHLGLADRFEAVEADVFPQGKADLVISNPPWIPEAAKNWLDLAVFDQEHRFLSRYLEGLAEHLEPGGVGLLLLSNLAVLLGLTSLQWLEEKLAQARLRVSWTRSTQAKHPKSKDSADPLHAVRSREVVTLYALDYLGKASSSAFRCRTSKRE